MKESGTYTEEAEALGLAEATSSRGAVCADFDQDGDTDILGASSSKGCRPTPRPPARGGDGPVQLGTLLRGPIAASQPGHALVLRHPELPPP